MYVNRRLLRTKFLPLFVQRRFPAHPQKVWGHGTVSRSDGLCKIQGTVWRKLGAVRTLRSASFKHKNNTLRLYSQQPKTNFGRLNNYIRFYLWKRKIPPSSAAMDFVGWSKRQNESGVLRGGIGIPHSILDKRKCERRQWRHSHKRLLFLISIILYVN